MEQNLYIKCKGTPRYGIWLKDTDSGKWHCWGQAHEIDEQPNVLEEINSGKYIHHFYNDCRNYCEVRYVPLDGAVPNS